MEHLTTVSEDRTTTAPAVLHEQGGGLVSPTWLQRLRQSRAGVLLSSFPSLVFLLALAFYLALTTLHLWLAGIPGSQPTPSDAPPLADWSSGFAASWARFDSAFFLHIAQQGYTDQGLGAFFPLYPLLIRLLAWPLGGHFTLAALLVSWLGAWGSYLWFFRLAQREYGEPVARFALLCLVCSPVSFFSFAPYSESLFLLLSLGAIERARAGRLWQASGLAALGMLTRPTGILLLLPLAWE
ncbi:MAG TPA: mannosyltransferase family protein, partial [Ktedonobacterales bacterium]